MFQINDNNVDESRDKSQVRLIENLMEKVLEGEQISFQDSENLLSTKEMVTLFNCANNITRKFNGDLVDIETLINAKSGNCPEDCSFCAQSSLYNNNTGIDKYPLLP